MLRPILLGLLLCVPTVRANDADDAKKKAVALAKSGAQQRAKAEAAAADLSNKVAAGKVGIIDANKKDTVVPAKPTKANPVRFPSVNHKRQYVAKLEEELAALQRDLKEPASKPEHFLPKLTLTKGGEVGRFPHAKAKVVSVTGKASAVLSTFSSPTDAEKPRRIEVLVTGVDTSEWADGLSVDGPPGAFSVATAKSEGRTLLSLSPLKFTDAEAKEILSLAKPDAGKP